MSAPFHNRLDAYIKNRGTKITKLEEATGKSRGALRRYRLNEVQPDAETTEKICRFFDITAEELFYFPVQEDDAIQRSDSALKAA